MKKYLILSLVAVMLLVSVAPAALAMESESNGNHSRAMEVKQELKLELKTEKQKLEDHIKELAKKLHFSSRAVTLTGTLVSVNTANASAPEVTLNLTSVGPVAPKNWPTSTVPYPAKGTNLTLKLTDKTPLFRGYWGKMKLAEMATGDEVRVVVKFNEDGTLVVKWLQDKSLHVILRKSGVVESINLNNSTFVLKQETRTVTVKTTSETKFNKMKDGTVNTLSTLKVGDKVSVEKGIINLNAKTVAASSLKIKTPVAVTPVVNQ